MDFSFQRERIVAALRFEKHRFTDLANDDATVVEEDYRLSNYVAGSVPLILAVTAGLIVLYSLSDLAIGEVDRFVRMLPLMGGTAIALLVLAILVRRAAMQRRESAVGILGVIAVGTISTYLAISQVMMDQSILYSLPYVFLLSSVSVPFWPGRTYFFAGAGAGALPFMIVFVFRPEPGLLEFLIPMAIIAFILLYMVQETISRANRRMYALAYEVQYRASHDVMTTLSSRSHWLELAAGIYASAMIERRPLCIFYLDIDHFKSINDRYGHDLGDETLKRVAEAVAVNVPRRDLVSRFGGEEFVKLLPDTSLPQAIARARALHQRVLAIDHLPTPITVSVGVAEAVPGQTLEQLITRADRAMLRAKESGRNRTVIATADPISLAEPPPTRLDDAAILTENDLAS